MDDQPPWSNHKIEKKKKTPKKKKKEKEKRKRKRRQKPKQNSCRPYISFSKKSGNFNIPSSYWLQLEKTKTKS
jgi:hypothetical protein